MAMTVNFPSSKRTEFTGLVLRGGGCSLRPFCFLAAFGGSSARGRGVSDNEVAMRYLIAILALAGIFDSCLALRIHNQNPSEAPPCAVSEKFDCGVVNHGRYSVFPPISFDEAEHSGKIHIPVAMIGIVGYALIAVLVLGKQYWLTLQAAEIGFACAAFCRFSKRT